MKFKAGDKVMVKPLSWCNANKGEDDQIHIGPIFVEEMSYYCGKIATVRSVETVSGNIFLHGEFEEFTWHEEFLQPLSLFEEE